MKWKLNRSELRALKVLLEEYTPDTTTELGRLLASCLLELYKKVYNKSIFPGHVIRITLSLPQAIAFVMFYSRFTIKLDPYTDNMIQRLVGITHQATSGLRTT